jgi:UDP-glucose 4-epimerase
VTGQRDAIKNVPLIDGDLHDAACLEQVFATYAVSAVMHFAGFIQVNESVRDPARYYHNNVAGTLNLLQAMFKAGVKHFIFSSTAAVYGEPQYAPINEQHPLAPINPYGHSKLVVEQILAVLASQGEFKYTALRYFNAAGADPEAGLAERHDPETHLIPLILQVAAGQRDDITVYGNDYPTADGTCVRDYVHVNDICDAHLLALQALWEGKPSGTYNLGTGEGYSVQQVIDMARQVTGLPLPQIAGQRRAGDPAVLVADATRIMQELGWRPHRSGLQAIIESAWQSLRLPVRES